MKQNPDKLALEKPLFLDERSFPSSFLASVRECAGTFVDVGAGDGGNLRWTIENGHLSRFSTIIGIDISELRVARLRVNVPEAKAILGDAEALALPDGSVDYLFSDQVIEHVPDDRVMVLEVSRVLRPGGFAFIGSVLRQPGAWYFYRCNGKWTLAEDHVREYESVDEYRAVFEKCGLRILDVSTAPVTYKVFHMALRALIKLRLLDPTRAHKAHDTWSWVAKLLKFEIRIPRYHMIYALLQRPVD